MGCTCTPSFPVSIHFNPNHPLPNNLIDLWAQFTTVPPHRLTDPFPTSLRQPTLELASSNLVCSVTLTGVLALQAGRWWAERVDDAEEESVQSLVQEDDDVTKRRKEKAAEVKASGSGTRKLQKRQVQS